MCWFLSLVILAREADQLKPPSRHRSCKSPFLKHSVGGKCRTSFCPRGKQPTLTTCSVEPHHSCRQGSTLGCVANVLHKPNPPSTNPSKPGTNAFPFRRIFLPLCTCSLQPQVYESFHFFPNKAPRILICSWHIPLCNLITTTLLSPSWISTHHIP